MVDTLGSDDPVISDFRFLLEKQAERERKPSLTRSKNFEFIVKKVFKKNFIRIYTYLDKLYEVKSLVNSEFYDRIFHA